MTIPFDRESLFRSAAEIEAAYPSGLSRSDESNAEAFAAFDAKVNDFLGALADAPEGGDLEKTKSEASLIHNGKDGESTEERMARLSDEAFYASITPEAQAVLMARYLLAHRHVRFNPPTAPNWDRFATRYQDIILEA